MHDPAVLILDEPTSGLDPLMQNRFIDLILEEKQRGKTVLMSSHMFEEVERTCARVGILREGAPGRRGGDRHTEGASQPHLFRHAFHTGCRGSFLRPRPACGCRLRRGCTVTVRVRDGMSALTAAMARFPVTSIDAPRQSLEDVFLHYYGKEAQS